MKIAVVVDSKKQAREINELAEAFIVPISKFSVNYGSEFTLDDIKDLKMLNKEIFVAINKNIHNNELEKLETLLLAVDNLGIKGIIYYDVSILNLKHKLNLKTDLVWAQEHLTTNYGTINYWYEKGSKYAYLSSELTKEEIIQITKNTKSKLFLTVFGHVPMFTSRRHLVDNYLNYFDLKDKGNSKKIYKENKAYPIEDKETGTTVYSDYVLNLLDEDFSNIDYLVFDSHLISDEDFKDTVDKFREGRSDYKFPFNHGFLYEATFYKVKNNE